MKLTGPWKRLATILLMWIAAGPGVGEADWDLQLQVDEGAGIYLPACYSGRITDSARPTNLWESDSGSLYAIGGQGVRLHRDKSGVWSDQTGDSHIRFADVWGVSDQHVFAVGYGWNEELVVRGVIHHFDGSRWTAMQSATYGSLYGIWGSSAENVFAVGDYGTIVHFDGSAWTPMASWTDEDLRYVNGTSDRDVFAVGRRGHVFHYDGNGWRQVADGILETGSLESVAGDSLNNIYAVNASNLFHFDGQQWRTIKTFENTIIDSMAISGSALLVSGRENYENVSVLRYDQNGWQTMETDALLDSATVFAGNADGDVFLIGLIDIETQVYRLTDDTWELIGTETPQNRFHAVWGLAADDIVAVGQRGMVYRFNGSEWNRMTVDTGSDLHDVWGSGTDAVYAVGDDGVVLYWNGTEWIRMNGTPEVSLRAVWRKDDGEVVVVGDGGTILVCDKANCRPEESGTDQDLTGVWADENGTVYAVGTDRVFLTRIDQGWVPAPNRPGEDLWPWWTGTQVNFQSMWGTSASDVYVLAATESTNTSSVFCHFDGQTWSEVDDSAGFLFGQRFRFWGPSPGKLFLVVYGNTTIEYYDGSDWTGVIPFDKTGFNDVWGYGSEVYCVGDNGTIIHSSMPDHTAPTILSVSPYHGATDVGVQPYFTIQFSEPVAGPAVVITDENGRSIAPAPGSFGGNKSNAWGWTILDYGTTYTVTVPAETRDIAGNTLGADYSWSFTTRADDRQVATGVSITDELWLGATINTGDQGEIEGRWQLGGEDTTARGDRVIWGYFYADPADVSWGDPDNPDLFVKIWFDVTGSLYISYFHVSVPEIRVASLYPVSETSGAVSSRFRTATLSRRHVGDFYYYRPESGDFYTRHTDQFENGLPMTDDAPVGNPAGYVLAGGLRIGAVIHTEYNGPLEGLWQLGGEATTQRGDQVLWGYFYADPEVVNWGSRQNPDGFVKAWYDVSGAVFLDFFHVSVPDIEVFSAFSGSTGYENRATTVLDNRFIEHRYWHAN